MSLKINITLFFICISLFGSAQNQFSDIKKALDTMNNSVAFAELTDYISKNGSSIEAHEFRLNLADSINNKSYYLADINWLIANNSSKNDFYYYKKGCFCKISNSRDAISDFSKSIEFNPSYWDSYFERALLYFRIPDKMDQASTDFTSYINAEVFTRKSDALVFRGRIFQQQEKFKDALVDFNLAIKLNYLNREAFVARGLLKIEMGDDGCSDLLKYQTMGGEDAQIYITDFCK
ncbi:MAG: hypothetical protein WCK02_04020 [Bacteroidota bacterium]